jgi:hypothetical protein
MSLRFNKCSSVTETEHQSLLGYDAVYSQKQTDVSEVHFVSSGPLIVQALHTSETTVCFNETTWRHIPEACHLHAL